jgi:inhibitor of KinA
MSANDVLNLLREAYPSKSTSPAEVRLLDAGECAFIVEFGSAIDPVINDRVIALDDALASAGIQGIEEVMPTYKSLVIHYDPLLLERNELVSHVRALLARPNGAKASRRWLFPACYDEELALDMKEVAWSLGVSDIKVVETHTSVWYRIFMHGFAPGLPALGGLPEALRLPRRMVPRAEVVEGSLIIAARQASIASVNMPCGWHVLGRTPERLFVLDRSPLVLTSTGDEIRFDPIDRHTFDRLRQRALSGETVAKVVA